MVNDKFTVVPLQIKVLDKLTAVTAKLEVTVTVCILVAVLPHASVAVHTTVVVPNGNTEGALLVTTGKAVQLSVIFVGVPNIIPFAEHAVVLTETVMFAGAVMVGAVTSCTLIVCDAVDELPQASIAVHVLVTLYEPTQAPAVVTSA